MAEHKNKLPIPDEVVINRILLLRGKRVMLDRDLAELYGVSTTRLNEQVKRNSNRFPEDFMFQLNQEEKQTIIDHYSHLENLKYSPYLPNVFTEHGAVMLASVLNSDKAIEVNIEIVRIFTRMREIMYNNKDILLKLEEMEKQVSQHSEDIKQIFEVLRELLNPPEELRKSIGFKQSGGDKSEE